MSEERLDEEAGRLFDEMIFAAKDMDDERAHSREDDFRERILVLISQGHPKSKELAEWALKTSKLGFSRWCA